MPATAARIAFCSQEFRTVAASDSAIKTRYGAAARDTLDAPVETFFDSASDTQAMVDERFALLKRDARKFSVEIARLVDFSGGLSFLQTVPAATLIDTEKGANLAVAITSINALDYDAEKTTVTVWG